MDKDVKIIAVLAGYVGICIGSILGGSIIRKINGKFEKKSTKIWVDITNMYADLLEQSYKRNDELKKQLESKGEA